MPKVVVITTTRLRTRYVVEAPTEWEARQLVNDDKTRAKLTGYPAGFKDDERVDSTRLLEVPADDD